MSDRTWTRRLSGFVFSMFAAASVSAQFSPPPCTGAVFNDVTCGGLFDAWIEQYAADQITGGCGGGNYCPNSPVTRAQMAVFVEKSMRGTASWSPGDRGAGNTSLGASALIANTNAGANTALGDGALQMQSFDNGGSEWFSHNTAVGVNTLTFNQPTTIGEAIFNTAIGSSALFLNTTGHRNTAVGAEALDSNEDGFNNTAVGESALSSNQAGFNNTAVGYSAGSRSDTVTGYAGAPVALTESLTGNYNTFIGPAGATAQVDNCTAVGMDAYCDATNQVRLGNFFVGSIGGKVAWSALSDGRAKTDVKEMESGLPLVLALKPVTYRLKGGNGKSDMGFVAQDVEVLLGEGYNVVDAGGDPDRTLSLRYTELIAPLVKAVQEQQAQIETLRAELAALRAQRNEERVD